MTQNVCFYNPSLQATHQKRIQLSPRLAINYYSLHNLYLKLIYLKTGNNHKLIISMTTKNLKFWVRKMNLNSRITRDLRLLDISNNKGLLCSNSLEEILALTMLTINLQIKAIKEIKMFLHTVLKLFQPNQEELVLLSQEAQSILMPKSPKKTFLHT